MLRYYTVPQVMIAATGALLIMAVNTAMFTLADATQLEIREKPKQEKLDELPIAVQPVMDELPLLKLGGKKVKPRLPDMWKPPPEPVIEKTYEAKSKPSEKAEKAVEAIPDAGVAIGDAEAPPPDAKIVAKADELPDEVDAGEKPKDPEVEGEGDPSGVKEGTEADPLKARAVNQYRARLIGWFLSRFNAPNKNEIPCAQLKSLSARATANIGGGGTVSGYSISGPSGNSLFDARVKAALDSSVGQSVPPPPSNYPDLLEPTVFLNFRSSAKGCQ